ncbi:MAG: hypothetical protein VX768_00050 [Planctomycetota bacterium]|nr:hypothetical protein [Planctomycetota bacterium]
MMLPCKRAFGVFSLLFVIMIPVSQAQGQVSVSDESREYRKLVQNSESLFSLLNNGSITVHLRQKKSFITPLPVLQIFANQDVTELLEIADYQQKELQEKIVDLEKATEKAWEIHAKYAYDGARKRAETIKVLRPAFQAANKQLQEILIDKQTEDFKMMLAQLEISRRGIDWYLNSDESKDLELSQAQMQQLKKLYSELIADLNKKTSKMRKETVAALLNCLPPDFRKEFVRVSQSKGYVYNVPLAILAIQLTYVVELQIPSSD